MSAQPSDLAEHMHRLRALYGSTAPTPPEAEHLRQQLQHVAEALPGQLTEAAARPAPDVLEAMQLRLTAAANLVGRLRDAVTRG